MDNDEAAFIVYMQSQPLIFPQHDAVRDLGLVPTFWLLAHQLTICIRTESFCESLDGLLASLGQISTNARHETLENMEVSPIVGTPSFPGADIALRQGGVCIGRTIFA